MDSVTGDPSATATRSGFVALAGRPNVGKSTLANGIVGAKVAIVSDKPQTTRRAIRGVANGPDWQLVLVDLPGVQRPRDALTERMQLRVERELADADSCLLVVNAQQGIGPGDRFIAELLRRAAGGAGSAGGMPITIAVNKVDRAEEARIAQTLSDAEALDIATEIFPVSARTGAGVPPLVDHLVSLLPEGPLYFAAAQRSDQSPSVVLAELVREQVLARTREELPHAVEVEVQEILHPRPDLVRIEAVLLSETESQKGILIGSGGRMIKSIGIAARRAIELELGTQVHLELSVRVRRHWRADERVLDRLGIE
ncbi:MAG TPA: GTPase Era [Solirubrobacteraceae bacterium]|jgi:GTP-binding protein Era|nr:GTPase Era [Solirubrobacteraceae bacterium]